MIVKQDTGDRSRYSVQEPCSVQKGWCKKDKGEDVTSGESEVLG